MADTSAEINFEAPDDLIKKVEDTAGLGQDPKLPEGTKVQSKQYSVQDEELLTKPDDLADVTLNTEQVSTDVGIKGPRRKSAETYQAKSISDELKTHIHSMSLKAFVKDMVEKGVKIDLDLFGAFVARTAVVKRK